MQDDTTTDTAPEGETAARLAGLLSAITDMSWGAYQFPKPAFVQHRQPDGAWVCQSTDTSRIVENKRDGKFVGIPVYQRGTRKLPPMPLTAADFADAQPAAAQGSAGLRAELENFVLVPREPTAYMLDKAADVRPYKAVNSAGQLVVGETTAFDCWEAFIAAVPASLAQPAPEATPAQPVPAPGSEPVAWWVPEGYALVPIISTREMNNAGEYCRMHEEGLSDEIFEAMIAKAPVPPVVDRAPAPAPQALSPWGTFDPEDGLLRTIPSDVLAEFERAAHNHANLWTSGNAAARQSFLVSVSRAWIGGVQSAGCVLASSAPPPQGEPDVLPGLRLARDEIRRVAKSQQTGTAVDGLVRATLWLNEEIARREGER